jgi:hypothetical protein
VILNAFTWDEIGQQVGNKRGLVPAGAGFSSVPGPVYAGYRATFLIPLRQGWSPPSCPDPQPRIVRSSELVLPAFLKIRVE